MYSDSTYVDWKFSTFVLQCRFSHPHSVIWHLRTLWRYSTCRRRSSTRCPSGSVPMSRRRRNCTNGQIFIVLFCFTVHLLLLICLLIYCQLIIRWNCQDHIFSMHPCKRHSVNVVVDWFQARRFFRDAGLRLAKGGVFLGKVDSPLHSKGISWATYWSFRRGGEGADRE